MRLMYSVPVVPVVCSGNVISLLLSLEVSGTITSFWPPAVVENSYSQDPRKCLYTSGDYQVLTGLGNLLHRAFEGTQ